MVLFGTEEWIKALIESVNKNQKFLKRAKEWEGDFIFVINSDGALERELYLWVDLYHGRAIDGRVLMSRDEIKADNLLEGSYGNWIKLLEGHLDLIEGIMTNRFNYQGDIIKMMQNFRVGIELVNSARVIETEFY